MIFFLFFLSFLSSSLAFSIVPITSFVKRSVSSVQSASSLSFSSLVFSSPSRREAAAKQRVTNRLLTVKSASGKTYSQLAAET
ncbi:hypothetical protein YC2023_053529 [Brassica napus]